MYRLRYRFLWSIILQSYLRAPLNFAKKGLFEKILETDDYTQKSFISFIKANQSKLARYGLHLLLVCDYNWCQSPELVMSIINFFLKYELLFFFLYGNDEILKNIVTLMNLSNTFAVSPECADCANAQNIIIQRADQKLIFAHEFVCKHIIEILLNVKSSCSHSLFNKKLADFIANNYPNSDYNGLWQLISFFEKNRLTEYELQPFTVEDLLEQDSAILKTLVLLSQYTEQIPWDDGCNDCKESKASFIKQCLAKGKFQNETSFWFIVINKVLTIEKPCSHNLFNAQHLKFLKTHHSYLDELSFLKIISFLSKTNSLHFTCNACNPLSMLDRNSTVFKNLLYLADHYAQEDIRAKIDALASTSQSQWCHFLSTACGNWQKTAFETTMGRFNCPCDQCSSMRNRTVQPPKNDLPPVLKKILLRATAIVVGCIIIVYIAALKKNYAVSWKGWSKNAC